MLINKKMKRIIKVILFIVFVAYVGHQSVNKQSGVKENIIFDNIEAMATCEVSSDTYKNTGTCHRDVNNSNEYCVFGWGGAQCCGTI